MRVLPINEKGCLNLCFIKLIKVKITCLKFILIFLFLYIGNANESIETYFISAYEYKLSLVSLERYVRHFKIL